MLNRIRRRFLHDQEKHPHSSSFIHFTSAIRGTKAKEEVIKVLLVELVERTDYVGVDREELFKYLVETANS
jgi:hypothetical protein